MDIQAVFPARLVAHLTDGLQERLGFDIAGGSPDFGNNHVRGGFLAHGVNEFLNHVRYVGDDLHGGAQVFAPALPAQHPGEHLTGGKVGILVQILVDKALVMAQIQVGFRAVLGHIDLAVLIGTHGAGIHVDVGVQLLGRDFQPPRLQKPAQRCGGDALAQTGDHAASDEDVLCHKDSAPFRPCPKQNETFPRQKGEIRPGTCAPGEILFLGAQGPGA